MAQSIADPNHMPEDRFMIEELEAFNPTYGPCSFVEGVISPYMRVISPLYPNRVANVICHIVF